MGTSYDRAPGGSLDLFEAHGQPELAQALHETLVAFRPVASKLHELVLQGTVTGLDEIAEDVHRPGGKSARDLAPGTRRIPRLSARALAPRSLRDRRDL